LIFEYKNKLYPEYLKSDNTCQFINPVAQQFCRGKGLDIGANKWPLPGAVPIDRIQGDDALDLPGWDYDYIFSSHCLEHIENPIQALEHWKSRL